jgi:hypothetical protein
MHAMSKRVQQDQQTPSLKLKRGNVGFEDNKEPNLSGRSRKRAVANVWNNQTSEEHPLIRGNATGPVDNRINLSRGPWTLTVLDETMRYAADAHRERQRLNRRNVF